MRPLVLLLCAGSLLGGTGALAATPALGGAPAPAATSALAARCEDLPKHGNFPVVDAANVIAPEAEGFLIADLMRHQIAGDEAIVVATVPTTGGDDISSYAKRLFDCWGVGDAESDNGILVLVAMRERRARIELGAGLEGRLNEAELETALDAMVAPLRAGDVGAGLRAAAVSLVDDLGGQLPDTRRGTGGGARPTRAPGDVEDDVVGAVDDDMTDPFRYDPQRDVTPYAPRDSGGSGLAVLVPIVIVLGVVAKIAGALFRGGGFSGGGSVWRGGFPGSGVGFGTGSMFRGGGWHSVGSSGWSGHSPSTGSSGSGSSGGGSSFGGGSSGGGGASGSW